MGPSDSWACHALSACSVFTPHAQVSRVAHSTFCTHAAPITPVGHQAWSIAATWHLGLPRFWDGSAPTQSSRGLLRLHSRCGLRTRSTSFRGLLLRGFGSEGHPSSPPDGFRGASTIPRAGLPPAGDVHLSRRTQTWTKSAGYKKDGRPVEGACWARPRRFRWADTSRMAPEGAALSAFELPQGPEGLFAQTLELRPGLLNR